MRDVPSEVYGVRHLCAAIQRPCLIVANHVLLRPEDTMVSLLLPPKLPAREWLTRNHHLLLFYAPPDSFILRRIVREHTGQTLQVVSISNLGKWSRRAPVRLLQAAVSHPFANGLRESLGYLPLEHTGRSHRAFLQSVESAVQQGQPVLIFPGTIVFDEPWHPRDTFLEGEISPGAAHLAAKYGLPILPAYTSGGSSWRAGQEAHVNFGPAFHCAGMTKTEAGREMASRVRALSAVSSEGEDIKTRKGEGTCSHSANHTIVP